MQTITIDATIESAVTLALIVLVRTFLSFSLEIELEGVVPWHRRRRDNGERAVAARTMAPMPQRDHDWSSVPGHGSHV